MIRSKLSRALLITSPSSRNKKLSLETRHVHRVANSSALSSSSDEEIGTPSQRVSEKVSSLVGSGPQKEEQKIITNCRSCHCAEFQNANRQIDWSYNHFFSSKRGKEECLLRNKKNSDSFTTDPFEIISAQDGI